MKNTTHKCPDCGSQATHTIVDEVKPVFKIEQFHFPCGAVLESSFSVRGQLGKISHKGCQAEDCSENNMGGKHELP